MPRPAVRRPSDFAAAEVCEPRCLLTTFVVTDGGDVTADDGVLTYREALLAAEAEAGADIITFAEGVDAVTLAANLGAYADDLTVAGGDGVTIRHRGHAGAAFSGGTVLLSNLTLVGADAASRTGDDEDEGGALLLSGGADVTLNEVFFLDNAAGRGGAVRVADFPTRLTMVGGGFRGNAAGVGGGVDFATATAGTFTDVTFRGNTARAGGGVFGFQAALTFTDVLAYENVAGLEDGELSRFGRGGFLDVGVDDESSSRAAVTVTGGRFTRNYATLGGGAINADQELTVTGAVFSKNQSLGRGDAFSDGGAIVTFQPTTISDSVFFRNVAAADSPELQDLLGDGVDLGDLPDDRRGDQKGGAVRSGGFLTVTDAKFNRNSTTGDGGALWYGTDDASLVNVRMFNNSAGKRGGAVAVSGSGNLAAEGGRYAQNSAGGGGGAFFAGNDLGTLSLSDLVVNRNVSRGDGPDGGGGMLLAIAREDFIDFPQESTITLDDVFAARNRATGDGAGGGAILALDRDLVVLRSNLAGNRADAFGGTVAVFGQTATFRNSFLRGGEAVLGGGLYLADSQVDGTATVARFTRGGLIGNDATRGGGAYLDRGDNELTLNRGAVARGNRADRGGALFLDRDTLADAADAVFRDNSDPEFSGPGTLRR